MKVFDFALFLRQYLEHARVCSSKFKDIVNRQSWEVWDMDMLHILAFDVLPCSTDYVFEVKYTHGLISIQVYATFGGEESKAFFLRTEAVTEL